MNLHRVQIVFRPLLLRSSINALVAEATHEETARLIARAGVISSLPPKADMCGATQHVCFVPIADMTWVIRLSRRRAAGPLVG